MNDRPADGSASTRPFDDVTVLDLTVYPGGALAAMHLAEFGAHVIRAADVEASFVDDPALWLYANRGKQRVSVTEGMVAALASTADVVVVDRTPGRMAGAGLTYDQLRGTNPMLIHAWLPPHGVRGEASELPADELLLSAWTGVADQQPGATSNHPVAPVVPFILYEQGALGAAAIAAALVARRVTGESRAVTVSGLHAVAALNIALMIDLPGIFRVFGREKDGTGSTAMFRMYRCRDGKWIFVSALTPRFIIATMDALDLLDLLAMPGVEGDLARFNDPNIRPEVTARVAQRMSTRDSAEWARTFEASGVPYAPVQTREEWATSETVKVNRLLRGVRDTEHGDMTVPDVPVELSLTPGSVEPASAPAARADARRGLDDRARSNDTPWQSTGVRQLPLDGVVVVDTTKFLAGPFGCQILSDFGATVVKVDPRGGEDFRAIAGATYSALNRDKAQVELDLADLGDHDAFARLVQDADVLVENMSGKVVEKLHLDLAGLRMANPGLVHCHIDAWGAGPLADSPGFDPLLQARSGLMAALGGLDTPILEAISFNDLGTGTLAAFGIVAALYARTRLGLGQEVRASLSRTSIAFQGAEFTTFPDRPAPRIGRIDYVGDSPTHRYYACSDGWFALSAISAESRHALEAVAGVSLDGGPEVLEHFFASTTVRSALDACRAAGVPAVHALPVNDVYSDADLVANDFFFTIEDDDLGSIRAIRGFSEWDGVAPRRSAVMHSSGHDTDAVLGRIAPQAPR